MKNPELAKRTVPFELVNSKQNPALFRYAMANTLSLTVRNLARYCRQKVVSAQYYINS